jgi:hypothetical protein
MPVTYIYRIPLFEAFKYTLTEEGLPRADELDAEGTLYQIITMDDRRRLVKIEKYFEGELSSERTIFYDGECVVREEEIFKDSGTRSEIRYLYHQNGFTKEFYTEGEPDGKEAYTVNEKGVAVGCRRVDVSGEETTSWEANDRGDRLCLKDGEREVRFEHRYDGEGRVTESISRDGEQTIREALHYRDNVLIRHEVFAEGFRAEREDDPDAPAAARGEALVSEEIIEPDPQGRFEVRKRRQLVARGSRDGSAAAKFWPSKIEILFDERRRITDVLVSDHELILPELGINCESNAYYFFEYEDGCDPV